MGVVKSVFSKELMSELCAVINRPRIPAGTKSDFRLNDNQSRGEGVEITEIKMYSFFLKMLFRIVMSMKYAIFRFRSFETFPVLKLKQTARIAVV